MLLTTHFILLLFALGSSAHSLFRIQVIKTMKNKHYLEDFKSDTITNGSDIYKVKEKPNNTFKITEPKLKVPTLREITYLKIKETPSKDCLEKEKLPQEQGPDIDDSERPYTNGQGFQFLEFRPVEEQNSSEDDKNSNNHSNESKNDRSDYESVPDSDESSNESDDSNDSDSDESSDSDSDDSSDSDNDSSSDSDSDSSSQENWPDINENNKNSDGSKESNSDNHESKPDSHENNKDSDESRLSNGDDHDNGANSLERNKDSDQNKISENDNHESTPDESNNDSGSNGSPNNSEGANKDNSGGNESKNDSKERNNGNISSNDSNNDSKETNKGNSGTNESKNDSKESYNGNIGSNDSNNDSKETNKGNSGTNESKNDSKESYNGNIGSNDSNNDSKETNKGNSGTNESKNDSHELQNNSNKNDSHNESKADNNNVKGFSSDANDGNDKDNEDKGNGSRDTSVGLDERNGGSGNVNEISDNITPDTSQSTEPAAAVSKDETDSTKLQRRKRDIDFGMLPPPPVLQPLNTRILPDFIQRMLSNIPALNDVTSPDEGGESNYQNQHRPQNYGFHFNNNNGRMWNNLPFINQENYINEPSNMMNKEKQEEYQEDVPDSDASSSYDNSLYSENDSGYNAETDEGTDKSSDDNSIGGVWPNIGAPVIDFNNFMPHNPIPKEKELGNFGNEINKNSNIVEQREPTIERTTETHIENLYKKSSEKKPNKAPIYTPPPKTKININKDLKEKIEMSFDNIGKNAPPILTRFEENVVKTAVKNNETPLTFGMKLSGGNGFVWNDLADPGKYYLFGEPIDTDTEWNEPSYPATDKFHEYNTEPTSADEIVTEASEPTNPPPIHKDEVTTQRVPESSTESQPQKPTTECEKLNEPNKDSIDKDKDKLDDKKEPEAVQVALDDLLKKDEFWQWLTKWTAAYIGVLNERVEKLVKKEVARQVNKIMNVKVEKEKEKDKIDTNNKDLSNKNETIANVTVVEPANNTNEINTNNTTTEKSSPEVNNTIKIDTNNSTTEKSSPEVNNTTKIDTNNTTTEKSIPEANNTNDNIASEKDQINAVNKTTSDGHKSNKTTPTNTHTIYGNAIDSDHVTNIFIFYPNAESNATAKDIEAILGNKNNVVVLGKPPSDNKKSKPDCTTNSPFDDTTGIYAIDQKKDIVSNASEQTSQAPETATSQDPSAADSPVTVKIEDSTAATKPDASGTTEPTNSNSEPIANVSADTVSSNTTESTITINPEATNDESTTPSTITTVPDTSTTAPVQ